jgi:hypothetical protein
VTSSDAPDHERVARMLRGLAEAPRYRGVSFRGRADDAVFGPGAPTLVSRLVTATSRDLRVATENFATSSVYAIVGGAGRSVEAFSSRPREREVVFLPATMFRAVDTLDAGGFQVVVVEQLAFDDVDRPGDSWTPERVLALLPDHVLRSRAAVPVDVTTPGKYLGDLV